MKLVEKWKSMRKRNKVFFILLIFLLIIGIIGFFAYNSFFSSTERGDEIPDMARMENGMISASGTTVTDTVVKQLEFDSLETSLDVEEVYVSSGQSVKSGDKLLKLTDESVEDARKELEQKATEAEVAYNEQKIAYEKNVIEARKNADITLVEGEYADADYTNNLAIENLTVAELEEQVTEAKELAEEYEAAISSNYYYTYYEVEELQKEADVVFEYLMQLYEEWDIEAAEEAQKKGQMSSGSAGGMGGMPQELEYDPEKYSLYQDFDEAVSGMLDELVEAKEKYEEDTNKASYSVESAKADYEILNAQLQEAIALLEQKKVQLQAQCDMAKAEAELAESSYEAEVKQLTEELSKVSDENDIAKEDLQTFEEMLGDGFLYAQEDGEIMMLNAREEQALEINMPYLVYSDSSNVTVTVSVDQSYIAELSVGDKATVIISELGTYEGEITSINPVSQSNSRSSIYYSVVVTLSGDVSDVTSNLTATVMFVSEDMQQSGEKPEQDKMKPEEDGEMPPHDGQQISGEKVEGEQESSEKNREGKQETDKERSPEGMESGRMEGMSEKPEEAE